MDVCLVLLVFAVVLNTGESRIGRAFQDNPGQANWTKEESEIESLSLGLPSWPSSYSPPVLTTTELETNNWEMVFRATAGNGQNAYDAWTTGTGTSSVKPVNMKRSLSSHFRDPGVDRWSSHGITYVKFALYKDNMQIAHVIFRAHGSTATSWFSSSSVVDSSWSELTSTASYVLFSVKGSYNKYHKRRFHIASEYGGCDGDKGFVAAIEEDGTGCNWDSHPSYPQFIYSDMDSPDYFNRRQFGRADYMAVFVYIPS